MSELYRIQSARSNGLLCNINAPGPQKMIEVLDELSYQQLLLSKSSNITRQMTDWIEQGPALDANSFWATQKNSENFVKTENALPCSQEPATSYPEPDQGSALPPSYFLKIHFNNILLSAPRASECFLSQ